MTRGELRIYLGAASGVGKTYAMLDEGRRRVARGTDVVVGAIDTHGRPATRAQLEGLEVVGRRTAGSEHAVELDVAAFLERSPEVVLVDEMARVDSPGTQRYVAIDSLLAAGIDVLTTVDIGQLASLADTVARVTGVPAGPVVPDPVVRGANQIHLVDQTPEALRRRLAHGNIHPPEALDAELANAYRHESLVALRELSLSWMANRVEEGAEELRRNLPGTESVTTREVVVVALTGAPSAERVIRRAAVLADRQRARLIGVHVRSIDPATSPRPDRPLDAQRRLLTSLGGDYREVASGDVASALVDVASTEHATQLVIGSPRRSRWTALTRGSLVTEVLERSPVDVHVVSTLADTDHGPGRAGSERIALFSPRRRAWSWVVAVAAPMLIALALAESHNAISLSTRLLLMVLGVTLAAVVGGARPATLAAVEAFMLSNYLFIPPLHELTISSTEDGISLGVFLVVALAVGGYVSMSARRAAESLQARTDASTLAAMAGAVASAEDPLPGLVERLREVYDADGASLFTRADDGWVLVASAGPDAPSGIDDATQTLTVGDECRLLLSGAPFRAVDPGTSAAFLDQLSVAVEQRQLRAGRVEAAAVASANDLRAALLAAVSHDLRTPLASVKAAVSSLRQPGIDWPEDVRSELLESIEMGTDRLTGLIANLLDMSRIQAGVVDLRLSPVLIDEVVHRAALSLAPRGEGTRSGAVRIDLDDRLPAVLADGALLGHVVANLLDNACKWSPPGAAVVIDGRVVRNRLHLRVIDRGPGIPAAARATVRQPFQRLDDSGSIEGTGLGLAVADGLARLMNIELLLEDTPGGGTTATLTIPVDGSADIDGEDEHA